MESIVGGGTLSIRACSHTENMAGLRDYIHMYYMYTYICHNYIPIYYYIKKEKSKKEKNTLNLDNDM